MKPLLSYSFLTALFLGGCLTSQKPNTNANAVKDSMVFEAIGIEALNTQFERTSALELCFLDDDHFVIDYSSTSIGWPDIRRAIEDKPNEPLIIRFIFRDEGNVPLRADQILKCVEKARRLMQEAQPEIAYPNRKVEVKIENDN